jgi:hypothetical protein
MADAKILMTNASAPADATDLGTDISPPSTPVDRLLDAVDAPMPLPLEAGLHVVRIEQLEKERARVVPVTESWKTGIWVDVLSHIDRNFLESAREDGQLALLQVGARGAVVVGVVQTRAPARLSFTADELELTANKRLTLRSGRAALRLTSDGAVELLGTRISATSRGVLRLLGRALRLN